MKKIAVLLVITLVTMSCKQDAEKELQTVEGEFIYLADAAVIKGDTFIYGVKLDEKMEELAMTVRPLKRDDFDMVPVIVKGFLNKKEEGTDGWDEILTIVEVVQVKAPSSVVPIKINGDKTNIKLDSLDQLKNK